MKFGILLERQISSSETSLPGDSEQNLPVLYSLLHPLDEVNPVIFKKGETCNFGVELILTVVI